MSSLDLYIYSRHLLALYGSNGEHLKVVCTSQKFRALREEYHRAGHTMRHITQHKITRQCSLYTHYPSSTHILLFRDELTDPPHLNPSRIPNFPLQSLSGIILDRLPPHPFDYIPLPAVISPNTPTRYFRTMRYQTTKASALCMKMQQQNCAASRAYCQYSQVTSISSCTHQCSTPVCTGNHWVWGIVGVKEGLLITPMV